MPRLRRNNSHADCRRGKYAPRITVGGLTVNEQTLNFIAAIGAMAESLSVFREQLIAGGFTRDEALTICLAYLTTTLQNLKSSGTGGKNEAKRDSGDIPQT
jgi:hypothetical protein